MRACTDDKRTIGDIKARGQRLSAEERTRRAVATVDRHATGPDDRATLLAMLGITAPPPKPAPAPRKTPDNRERRDRTVPPAEVCDWPCEKCDRQMFHRTWPEHTRAGRVSWGARGVCVTCYQHLRRLAQQQNRSE